MTTREIFFKKLYEKSENIQINVSEDLTEKEKIFLDKLCIFSKNNTWLKSYLCSSNKKTMYKRQYLNINSGYLKYSDFIELERCYENYKEFLSGLHSSLFIGTLLFSGISILRLKTNYELGPILKKSFILSFFLNFVHYIWFREKYYKPVINHHYEKLSQRMNTSNNNNKSVNEDQTNKEDDLVKNYFIKV